MNFEPGSREEAEFNIFSMRLMAKSIDERRKMINRELWQFLLFFVRNYPHLEYAYNHLPHEKHLRDEFYFNQRRLLTYLVSKKTLRKDDPDYDIKVKIVKNFLEIIAIPVGIRINLFEEIEAIRLVPVKTCDIKIAEFILK
jgi:hypothetical protein